MEKFSVSVNIEANSSVTFILTYEELLKRKMGQYEILTRIKPEQPVQDFQVGRSRHALFHCLSQKIYWSGWRLNLEMEIKEFVPQ